MNAEKVDAMVETFKTLPPERQDAVRNWMMIQREIAEHAGITKEEWFALIQEALDHPLDFGFIEQASQPGEVADLEKIDGTREKLGDKSAKNALEGEGIVESAKKGALEKELFQRFQAQKISFEAGRRNQPRKGKR
jgi:hypothetical protein